MIASFEAFSLLLYLLPGLLGVFVYEAIAETKKANTQQRVALVLALTIIGSYLSSTIFGISFFISPGIADQKKYAETAAKLIGKNLFLTSVVTISIGFAFSLLMNSGLVFKLLQILKITKRTGKKDVWHQAFADNQGKWVKIRFKNGTVLLGWPQYSGEDLTDQGIFLSRAAWSFPARTANTKNNIVINPKFYTSDVNGPGTLITNMDEILAIDFLD